MRTLNYAAISSICALLVGILLVVWPEVAVNYLVITVGALFFLPGVLGVFGYFMSSGKQEAQARPMFPIVALGSALLGLWLMVMPAFFVGILMYLLGALLVLGGLNQLIRLIAVRNQVHVPVILYVIPVLVLGSGLLILFNPFEAANVPFIILGVSAIIYGITDLIRLLRYRRERNKGVTDVEIIEG